MKSKLFLLLAVIATLASCSSVMDKQYDPKTADVDLKEVYEVTDSASAMLVAGTLLRFAFEGKNPETMTYQEILNNGNAYVAEEKRKAEEKRLKKEREEAERAAKLKKLTDAMSATCFEKDYREYDYLKYITFKFKFDNNTDKEIRAVKGWFDFQNLFGESVKKLSIVYDEPVSANSSNIYDANIKFNEFINSDVALKNKDLKDMKIVWIPEEILFADDTRLK